MDFRKLESNKILVKAEEVSITSKIEDIVSYFEEEAHHRGISLNFESSDEALKSWIDPGMLEKILFNRPKRI